MKAETKAQDKNIYFSCCARVFHLFHLRGLFTHSRL
jgi:hypothetical protein